jgi:hypothetical protein
MNVAPCREKIENRCPKLTQETKQIHILEEGLKLNQETSILEGCSKMVQEANIKQILEASKWNQETILGGLKWNKFWKPQNGIKKQFWVT